MGYTTKFSGVLKFVNPITPEQILKLQTILGEDCRDHPEWGARHLSYIDLKITKDSAGLQWDGSEKTYDLPEKVNVVIDQMQKEFPEFALTGRLLAQGEEVGDVWHLVMENNRAVEHTINL